MDAKQYLESVVNRLQTEYLDALKKQRENDNAAYFWGYKEGLSLAVNIAFAHLSQLLKEEAEREKKIKEIWEQYPPYVETDDLREGRGSWEIPLEGR